MNTKLNVSTTRDDRRGKLVQVIDRADLFANAYTALAAVIDEASAPVGAYREIWDEVATRLRQDALKANQAGHRASARLVDIDAAQAAYEAWTPRRTDRE